MNVNQWILSITCSIRLISFSSVFSICFRCFSCCYFFFKTDPNFLFSIIKWFFTSINSSIESFSSFTKLYNRKISESLSYFSFLFVFSYN